ncbi:MAG: hypothetical protein K1X70_09635 [Leptospirales bacterium]|nr:hypothetical protein [Leptospirales bacterium]
MKTHDEREPDEIDVTHKYLNLQMHELPEELVLQLMELDVTTDLERMKDRLRRGHGT